MLKISSEGGKSGAEEAAKLKAQLQQAMTSSLESQERTKSLEGQVLTLQVRRWLEVVEGRTVNCENGRGSPCSSRLFCFDKLW